MHIRQAYGQTYNWSSSASSQHKSQEKRICLNMACQLSQIPLSNRADKLKAEAKIEGLPLNAMVNQILSEYLQWDRTATKAGWVVVLSDVLKRMMNELDEKTFLCCGCDAKFD